MRGQGGSAPNRNAGNDYFVTKAAVELTEALWIGMHLRFRPWRPFFFGLHQIFRTNSALQPVKTFFLPFVNFGLHFSNSGLGAPLPILN